MKKLDFIIMGAQKSGTSALASFLAQHPDVCVARPHEAHAFDHEAYAGHWTDALLDEYYGGFFEHAGEEGCLGECTPIYLYLPTAAEEIHNWNPSLKLLVILRDPVERALSHYRMAVAGGYEHLPLWLALLVEPLRHWLSSAPLAAHSSLRENSYRSRGLYARQLRRYLSRFPAEQLLVLRAEDLRQDHAATLSRVFAFLAVDPDIEIPVAEVNTGRPDIKRHLFSRGLLRLSYWLDLLRLRKLVPFSVGDWFLGR